MIRVAIVEDQEQEQRHIQECLDYLAQQEQVRFDVRVFDRGDQFLFNYTPDYDIVLMDIEMPGQSGLETARALRRVDPSVILIFVTALAQYALQGYDVDAMSYIVKPVSRQDFAMKLTRAVHRTSGRAESKICIKTDDGIRVVRPSDVRYLEVTGHYVTYHTLEGEAREYITLKKAEEKLRGHAFVRCHRFYVVNLRYVTAIARETVFLGDEQLMLAQSQRKAFLSAYAKFMGGVE